MQGIILALFNKQQSRRLTQQINQLKSLIFNSQVQIIKL